MKKSLKVCNIIFLTLLLITTIAFWTFWYFATSGETNDDIFGHAFDFQIGVIIILPLQIAECLMYKELRYFIKVKNKHKVAKYLRLVTLILSSLAFLLYGLICLTVLAKEFVRIPHNSFTTPLLDILGWFIYGGEILFAVFIWIFPISVAFIEGVYHSPRNHNDEDPKE